MDHFICVTCGTQFPAGEQPPAACPICDDDRQYLGRNGQQWTTLAELRTDHANELRPIDPGITGIVTVPQVAIGQQAHLIQTSHGNVLCDCISYLDDATIAAVRELGGIAAITISHPHFFSAMIEWAAAFDAPIYLHADHRPWVMRPEPQVTFWEGETQEVLPGVTSIRCGGHFPGSTVTHWRDGAEGKGALVTGDTIQIVADRRWVSFMYSYPNLIPMDADSVRRIVAAGRAVPIRPSLRHGARSDRAHGREGRGPTLRGSVHRAYHLGVIGIPAQSESCSFVLARPAFGGTANHPHPPTPSPAAAGEGECRRRTGALLPVALTAVFKKVVWSGHRAQPWKGFAGVARHFNAGRGGRQPLRKSILASVASCRLRPGFQSSASPDISVPAGVN